MELYPTRTFKQRASKLEMPKASMQKMQKIPKQKAVKRPISAYMLFRAGFVKRFRDADEGIKEVYARAKSGWDALTLDEQNIWETEFIRRRQLYDTPEQAALRADAKEALARHRLKKKRAHDNAASDIEQTRKNAFKRPARAPAEPAEPAELARAFMEEATKGVPMDTIEVIRRMNAEFHAKIAEADAKNSDTIYL